MLTTVRTVVWRWDNDTFALWTILTPFAPGPAFMSLPEENEIEANAQRNEREYEQEDCPY